MRLYSVSSGTPYYFPPGVYTTLRNSDRAQTDSPNSYPSLYHSVLFTSNPFQINVVKPWWYGKTNQRGTSWNQASLLRQYSYHSEFKMAACMFSIYLQEAQARSLNPFRSSRALRHQLEPSLTMATIQLHVSFRIQNGRLHALKAPSRVIKSIPGFLGNE